MTAWVLVFLAISMGGAYTVPGIESREECVRLAEAMKADRSRHIEYKCYAYKAR